MSSAVIKIIDIKSKSDGGIVTIAAVVSNIQEINKLTPKRGDLNRALRKRQILVSDDSDHSIWISLWNALAEKWSYKVGEIVTFSNFKIRIFNNCRSLTSLSFSAVSIQNMSGKERDTFLNLATKAQPIDGYLSIKELKANASDIEQFAWIKANILSFSIDGFYEGCVVCQKKKVSADCLTCTNVTKSEVKLLATMYVEDGVDSLKVRMFSDCVESLTDLSIEKLKERETDHPSICSKLANQIVAMRLKYKQSTYCEQEFIDVIALKANRDS
jgi:hypothetical protein